MKYKQYPQKPRRIICRRQHLRQRLVQGIDGELFVDQLAPELVENQIGPGWGTASSVFPSADDVTATQLLLGTDVKVQLSPELVEM